MARMIQAGGAALLLALAGVSAGHAQSASSSASPFSRGFSASASEMSNPVNVSTRDANGNRVILDGVIQNGSSNSLFGKLNVSGVQDQVSGAGATSTGAAAGTASAIGNNLVVVTQGSYNTVIVNATQTNNGPVTATTTVLNGKLNLGSGN